MATWWKRHLRIICGLAFCLAVLPGYLRAYKITRPSETPTINIGDTILVSQAAYTIRLPYSDVRVLRLGSPRRGDMVLLRLPDRPAVAPKRVIGLPGDTIEFKENRVFINGSALRVQPLNRADFDWVADVNRMGSVVANEDGHWISFTPGAGKYRTCRPTHLGQRQYFVAGDNRDESADSRIWGPVSEDRILGKVVVTRRGQ